MDNALIQKLKQDIEFLREPQYGYIRAGYPHFMALFGRDSLIISWQLLDYDISIAKNTIAILAQLQGKTVNLDREEEPGKIIHEWHPDPIHYKILSFPLPYYGSVDSTPLFIFLCGLYFEKTADKDWLIQYWPNIFSALQWCEKYGDQDADFLLEYERKNPLGLKHQGWKDGSKFEVLMEPPIAIIEAQGYYYLALCKAKELAENVGEIKYAQILSERAEKLKRIIIEKYWLDDLEAGYFALALDGKKLPVKAVTSNPGHLLFTGVLDNEPERVELICQKLFSEDMWTDYGIRTHSAKNYDFDPRKEFMGAVWPHDNWIIAQGLKRLGRMTHYQKIKDALLKAYQALGEIPEYFAVDLDGKISKDTDPRPGCSPQGWSSGALLNFLLENQ